MGANTKLLLKRQGNPSPIGIATLSSIEGDIEAVEKRRIDGRPLLPNTKSDILPTLRTAVTPTTSNIGGMTDLDAKTSSGCTMVV